MFVTFLVWPNFNVYITDEEKDLVQEVFNNAIDALSDEDKKLPQVNNKITGLQIRVCNGK